MSDYKKEKLCFTEVSDFTDFQGVGSTPLYQRYDSVRAVLRTCIDEKYQSFLAEPLYNADEDTIEWYVEKWEEHPRRLVDLTGEERSRYKRLMDEAVQHYRLAVTKVEDEDLMILGGVLKHVSEDMVYCYDNKVVMICWGMRYDANKHTDMGSLIQEFVQAPPIIHQVVFNPGTGGALQGSGVVNLPAGTSISSDMVPTIVPRQGYTFTGWDSNPVGVEVTSDREFTAQYERETPQVVASPVEVPAPEPPKEESKEEPPLCHVQFSDGGYGTLHGSTHYTLPAGATITPNMVPQVKSQRKYKFTGWDVNPQNFRVTGNHVFTARYKKKSIWSWLWWLLLLLLLLLLLILLLWNCKGCRKSAPPPPPPVEKEETPVEISHGDVEITLYWYNGNDVDLSCKDPKGSIINYESNHRRSPSGGFLEVDMNAGCIAVNSTNPIEHIYWPYGGAPHGKYTVKVNFYDSCTDIPESEYKLKLKYGNKVEEKKGKVSRSHRTDTFTFTFN